VRKAEVVRDFKALEQLARTAEVQRHPPNFLIVLARNLPSAMGTTRLELLRRTQRAHPGHLWANVELARELVRIDRHAEKSIKIRYAEAIRYFTAALALRPDNPGMYVNRGLALRTLGETDEAIADLRQACALAPHYAAAYANLGGALLDKGQLDKAAAAFGEALRIDKEDLWAHHGLGTVLLRTGRLDEAIVEFREDLRLDKHSGTARLNIALALKKVGDLHGAIKELEEALRHKEDLTDTALGRAMTSLAVCYWMTRRSAEAAKLNQETLALRKAKLGPTHPETLGSTVNLANCYHDLGRVTDAIKLLEATLPVMEANMPKHEYTRICADQLALCYFDQMRSYVKQGRHADAVKVARKSAELLGQRSDADNLYNAACCRALAAAWLRSRNKSEATGKEAVAEADKAMALLRKAVAAGFRDVALLKRDEDLAALRQREDFKELIAALEGKK
jgi:tetratricopeptide (TPR) repeat protein